MGVFIVFNSASCILLTIRLFCNSDCIEVTFDQQIQIKKQIFIWNCIRLFCNSDCVEVTFAQQIQIKNKFLFGIVFAYS